MKALKFKEVNVYIGRGQEEYLEIPAKIDRTKISTPISMCFELSEEEKEQVMKTGKIWLKVLTFGQSFHPISTSVVRPEDCTDPDELIKCEGCGQMFPIEAVVMAEDGNWYCEACRTLPSEEEAPEDNLDDICDKAVKDNS